MRDKYSPITNFKITYTNVYNDEKPNNREETITPDDDATKIVRRSDHKNCYVDEDDTTIVLLPPNPIFYDSVTFHRLSFVCTIKFYHFSSTPPPFAETELCKRYDVPTTYYLKCYEAANRSKVVAISDNDDYKSYHKMKLPVSFNNTDGLRVYLCEFVNSEERIKLVKLMEKIASGFISETLAFQSFTDSKQGVKYDIVFNDIVIDVNWHRC